MSGGASEAFQPVLADAADQRKRRGVERAWLPVSLGLLLLVALIILTVVNYLVSGIPNLRTGSTAWESDQPFPLVHISSWVVILMCAMSPLSALLLWGRIDARDARMLSSGALASVFFLGMALVPFPLVYSEPSPFSAGADRPLGWHWIGSIVALVGLLLFLVRRFTVPSAPEPLPSEYEQEETWLRARAERDVRARERLPEDLANLAERRNAVEREREIEARLFQENAESAKRTRNLSRAERDREVERSQRAYLNALSAHADAKKRRDRAGRNAQMLPPTSGGRTGRRER